MLCLTHAKRALYHLSYTPILSKTEFSKRSDARIELATSCTRSKNQTVSIRIQKNSSGWLYAACSAGKKKGFPPPPFDGREWRVFSGGWSPQMDYPGGPSLLWWGNRWQKTDSGFAVFWRRYFCQTEFLFILAEFLRLVAVMSMAVHGAKSDEGTSDLNLARVPQSCGLPKTRRILDTFSEQSSCLQELNEFVFAFCLTKCACFQRQENFCAKFFWTLRLVCKFVFHLCASTQGFDPCNLGSSPGRTSFVFWLCAATV